MTLTPEQMDEAVNAAARVIADADEGDFDECPHLYRALAHAALPVIRRAVLEECMNEAAAIAYQHADDHGVANTGGADAVLARLQALAGEEAT